MSTSPTNRLGRIRSNAPNGDWPAVLRGFAIALFMTGAPIALHVASQPVALIFCVAAAIVATRVFEQDVPTIVLVTNIFQNVAISLVSVNYADFSEIEVLKSYNFVTTIVCYLVVAYGFLRQPAVFSPFIRRMIIASVGVLAIVGVYFVLGLALSPRNAIIYLRNIGLPIFVFQTFLIVGVKHRLPLPQIVSTLLVLVMICCYIELVSIDLWLTLTNGWHYLKLFSAKRMLNVDEIRVAKEAGLVVTSPLDYTRSTFFNTALTSDLNLQVQRLTGPNFSTISLGYLLAILIAFVAAHRHMFVAALAMPLLLATSAKGPLALALGCFVFYAMARRYRSDFPLKALCVGLAVYAAFVFQSGLRNGDYHVLGLLGGLNGFVKWPFGHTLGDGGNLSIEDFSKLPWGDFQRAGMTSVAVESSVGVLLFQLGVAAAAVFAFYLWIGWTGWRLYRITAAPALAFSASAIFICLVNGLYQEEAYFAPLSLPVVMGLAALTLGATDRALAPKLVGRRDDAATQPGSSARTRPASMAPASSRRPKLVA